MQTYDAQFHQLVHHDRVAALGADAVQTVEQSRPPRAVRRRIGCRLVALGRRLAYGPPAATRA